MLCLAARLCPNSLQPHELWPARRLCPWGFSRQEYWNGLPCPPPGNLPNPGGQGKMPGPGCAAGHVQTGNSAFLRHSFSAFLTALYRQRIMPFGAIRCLLAPNKSTYTVIFILGVWVFLIYLGLHGVFVAARGLPPVAERGYSLMRCTGFSLRWLLLLQSTGSGCICAQWVQDTGLVTLQHVGSSWTRDQIHVPCTSRQILNHWTTREV